MDDNFNRVFDRLDAMDKRWDERFTEFKTEFDTRMYKGNGKPAVMDSLKDHEAAIEDLQRGVSSAKILAKAVEETACGKVKELAEAVAPLLQREEDVSWFKKNWKGVTVFTVTAALILVFIAMGFMWLNSKAPALIPILIEVAKKLAGG